MQLQNVSGENSYGNYILTVSSLDPRKNLGSLIRAFRQLALPDMKLVIVGGENTNVFGRHAYNLREIANENPQIVFAGYVTDAEEINLYRHARMFVYPSLYEGFGFPPLEAMACGCPVIASNTSSLPEVLGDSATFVDARNIEELASAITVVLGEDRSKTREAGKRIVARYSWDATAKAILSVVRNYE
jgi:glycosyltransferase involved in cell wall biosynthesis